jgi:hypothetical protein
MEIKLFPRVNKSNQQINFNLRKRVLPKEMQKNLSNLKSIKLNIKDFEF